MADNTLVAVIAAPLWALVWVLTGHRFGRPLSTTEALEEVGPETRELMLP